MEGGARERWLGHWVLFHWKQRVWRRRTQCNVDLVELQPVSDADAFFLTDTREHTVFRFSRRDVYRNLMSNLTSASDLLPTPRAPCNPYTNAPLTLAQTVSVCERVVADVTRRRGWVPPLLAAFCAVRFDIKRFQSEYASLLSQHAITEYFKEIHGGNRGTLQELLVQLLYRAHLSFSPAAIQRWLGESPATPLHREWLALLRDYTIYQNLRQQVRPHWYDEEWVLRDVAELYARSMTSPAAPSTEPTDDPLHSGFSAALRLALLELIGAQAVPVPTMSYSIAYTFTDASGSQFHFTAF